MHISQYTGTIAIIFTLYSASALSADPAELYFVDAHSQADSVEVLKKAIPLMDQAGVRHTILSGRRQLKSEDIATFAEQHPDRITAAIRTKGRAYIQNRSGYYQMLERDVDSGRFAAIAELLLYHAQKGNKADEILVYPDDPRVQTTLTFAKKNSWPLIIHIEFASLSGSKKTLYMKQLEALLTQESNHPFILIHMGQLRVEDVQRLITLHKNIYFLTSHTNPAAINISNQPWTPMFKGNVLTDEWRTLVVRHPDRFVLAFDNVWPDHWGEFYLREAAYWRTAFAVLPNEVAHAIAHGNAERLWKISIKYKKKIH